jgi:flagellar biosynthesis anti-sigma factor FlgM
MRITRIGSLFAANIDSVSSSSQARQTQSTEATTPVTQSEAVVLSPKFNRTPQNPAETEEAREARLKDLKQKVARGTYSVDSKKVAEAVYRDLA